MTPKELAELEKKYNDYKYTQTAQTVLRLIRDYRELEGKYKALHDAMAFMKRRNKGK